MKSISHPASFVNKGPEYLCQHCGKPLGQCVCRRHSVHFQHGEDRAILGLARTGCRNADQFAGYDAMKVHMMAFNDSLINGGMTDEDQEAWASELQRRLEAAERRRAWAIALAGTHETVIAAGRVFDVAIYEKVEVYA